MRGEAVVRQSRSVLQVEERLVKSSMLCMKSGRVMRISRGREASEDMPVE